MMMPIGPMATRGDLQSNDLASSPSIRNMFLRRKQAEKRPPFRKDVIFKDGTGITQSGQVSNLFVANGIGSAGTSSLVASGQTWSGGWGLAHYNENGSGTYTPFTVVDEIFDAVVHDNKFYMLTGADDATGVTPRRTVSWAGGATEADNALVSRFSGYSITSFIGRLFIAAPVYPAGTSLSGGAYLYQMNLGAEWTVSGAWAQPVLANNIVTATVANATTDKIKTTAAMITTIAQETNYTAQFWIQSATATTTTPITVRMEDAAGTVIYGYAEYIIPRVGDDANWRQYTVSGRIPASTAVYLSLQVGNSSGGGTVGAQFRLSDRTTVTSIPCAQIFPGRYAFPYYATTSVNGIGGRYTNRIVWSEALDPTDWRNESFAVCDDSQGDITAIRSVNGKLVVFKEGSMYVFRPTQSNVNPIVRESFLPGIGTYSPASIVEFDNKLIFIGEDDIYIYDGSGDPEGICGDGMKDELVNPPDLELEPLIAVDEYNNEIWVYTTAWKLYIYSLSSKSWTGYVQFTDSTNSETPFNSSRAGDIEGLVYFQGEMWVNVEIEQPIGAGEHTYSICRMTNAALETQDDVDGTDRDVKCWYTFHPLETERPRKQITLQSIGIDHKADYSQVGSTTRYSVSIDGGYTWPNYNEMTAYPLASGADGDTKIMRAYVHQTAPRLMFRVEHEGKAGPNYFNITGGEASVIIRGPEIQYPNPTGGSSSL